MGEINTYNEGFRKFLSSNKRMEPCLLRCPACHRIQVQKTLTKINERSPVIEFYPRLSEKYYQTDKVKAYLCQFPGSSVKTLTRASGLG